MPERSAYPDHEEWFRARLEAHTDELDFPQPGVIQSYNADDQTADILPAIRAPYPRPDGAWNFEERPVVPCVPILFPRAGRWAVSFSLEPGDCVLLVPMNFDPARWLNSDGSVQNPDDIRRAHLAHCVAIPGVVPRARRLANAPPPAPDPLAGVTFGADDGTRLSIFGDGSVKVTRTGGVALEIDAAGTVHIGAASGSTYSLVRADLLEGVLSSLQSAIDTWTPVPNDGGASIKAVFAAWITSAASYGAAKARGV